MGVRFWLHQPFLQIAPQCIAVITEATGSSLPCMGSSAHHCIVADLLAAMSGGIAPLGLGNDVRGRGLHERRECVREAVLEQLRALRGCFRRGQQVDADLLEGWT